MKTGKLILPVALVAGLSISATAQAFCFMKGNNNHSRLNDYYSYPPPGLGYSPAQNYPYPSGSQPSNGWYGYGYPASMPGQAGMAPQPGIQYRR